nr:hypothetical protein Itr_chr15CG15000 [Ipomoea trifida]
MGNPKSHSRQHHFKANISEDKTKVQQTQTKHNPNTRTETTQETKLEAYPMIRESRITLCSKRKVLHSAQNSVAASMHSDQFKEKRLRTMFIDLLLLLIGGRRKRERMPPVVVESGAASGVLRSLGAAGLKGDGGEAQ